MTNCPARCLVWSHRAAEKGTDGVATCNGDHSNGTHAGTIGVYEPGASRKALKVLPTLVYWDDRDRRSYVGKVPPDACSRDPWCVAPERHPGRCAP